MSEAVGPRDRTARTTSNVVGVFITM